MFCYDVSCGDGIADCGEYGGVVLVDIVDRDKLEGVYLESKSIEIIIDTLKSSLKEQV